MKCGWRKIRIEALRALPLWGVQLAWLVWTRLAQNTVLIDDAYIHFRNAANWAHGQGLLWNPGQAVLATTSPVYTIILGLLHRLCGLDFPRLATGFNFACEVGVTVLMIGWLRRAGIPLLWRHAIALIVNFEVWRMLFSHAGMEMSLFLLAWLLVLEFTERGVWPLAGLLLGGLGWIRPEGAVVWVAMAAGLAACRRWRDLLKTYGVASGLAACIAGLLLFKYGTFIPQSITAKANAPWFVGSNGYGPVQFLITLGDLTPFPLFNGFRSAWATVGDKFNSILVMLGQWALMGVGLGWLWRRGQRFFVVFLGVFFTGYYLFHAILATCIFYWYYVPYYFAAQLLAGIGWWALAEAAMQKLGASWPRRPALAAGFYRLAAPALALIYLVSGARVMRDFGTLQGQTLWSAAAYRLKSSGEIDRETQYVKMAEFLNRTVPRGVPVGCFEIGIFGYYFNGPVFDAFGLVSPEALDILNPEVRRTLPKSCQVFPFDVFMRFKPPYVMWAMVFIQEAPKEFLDLYEPVAMPDSMHVLELYKLKAGAANTEARVAAARAAGR